MFCVMGSIGVASSMGPLRHPALTFKSTAHTTHMALHRQLDIERPGRTARQTRSAFALLLISPPRLVSVSISCLPCPVLKGAAPVSPDVGLYARPILTTLDGRRYEDTYKVCTERYTRSP